MSPPRTLFEKLWDRHCVVPESEAAPAVLYIDLHLVHEVTSPQAFAELDARGLRVHRPERTKATPDHSTPTTPAGADGELTFITAQARTQVQTLRENCARHGVELFDFGSGERGIVHVIGPELGLTQPGMTIVCGDSHTATHGAFGALAFGIGTSEVAHVLATQCLLQRKPKTLAITVNGRLSAGVSAKDMILHIIGHIGVNGGTGHVIEYRGEAIRALSMEERMTVCNMSIEAGARAGLIAPDQTTFEWLRGRPRAPQGEDFRVAVADWQTLHSDSGAQFDREVSIDASRIRPSATWGTHPGQVAAIEAALPASGADNERALAYMGLRGGQTLAGHPVDVVFIGSCTNGRLSDLRAMAQLLRGRKVHPRVRMLVVPGSDAVKRAAEAEGIDHIVRAAGGEWREPGCSMCIAMNGDFVGPGQLAVSTSNRNFEGRQGKGARTVLASPQTAAASAIAELVSRTVVLPECNIDTDQIIPARFLTTTSRAGLGQHAFTDWRYLADGMPNPAFPLNRPENHGAAILVTGANFGCGSSREHAPWALLDAGIRAVISSEIADIFRGNALKNGLLPIVLGVEAVATLLSLPGIELRIDIARGEVTLPDGDTHRFTLDPFARTCLLEGVDQLGYLLNQSAAIQRYEEHRHAR